MQASNIQFDKVLEQGAENILQGQTNLIRTSRKAGKKRSHESKSHIQKSLFKWVTYVFVHHSNSYLTLSGESE